MHLLSCSSNTRPRNLLGSARLVRILVVLVQCCISHLCIWVILFRSQFLGISWRRSEPGKIEKQIIASLENLSAFMSAVSGSDKYADVARRIEGDIGVVAGAAAGLLDDHGWIIGLVEVHPTQADGAGNTARPGPGSSGVPKLVCTLPLRRDPGAWERRAD